MWKDYFYLSKSDRRAMAFIVSIITLATVWRVFLKDEIRRPETDLPFDVDTVTWQEPPKPLQQREADVKDSYRNRRTYGKYQRESKSGTPRKAVAVKYELDTSYHKPVYHKQEKYPYGTVLDLNAADTAQLKCVPGIGSYFAKRIVEYRDRLGGYISPSQLSDIDNLPDSLQSWFMVADTFAVNQISVNSASLTQLRAHPYMDFYKARAILEYRRRNGKIKDPAQLSLFDEFSERDFELILPYLSFD